jgi:hypothetical protein
VIIDTVLSFLLASLSFFMATHAASRDAYKWSVFFIVMGSVLALLGIVAALVGQS